MPNQASTLQITPFHHHYFGQLAATWPVENQETCWRKPTWCGWRHRPTPRLHPVTSPRGQTPAALALPGTGPGISFSDPQAPDPPQPGACCCNPSLQLSSRCPALPDQTHHWGQCQGIPGHLWEGCNERGLTRERVGQHLCPLLTGEAQWAYYPLLEGEAKGYGILKGEILAHCRLLLT